MKNSRVSISIKFTSFLLSVILVAGLLVVAPLPAFAEEAGLNADEGASALPPAAEGEEPEGDDGPAGTEGGGAAPEGGGAAIGEDETGDMSGVTGGGLSAMDISPTDVCAIGTEGYATLAAAVAAVPPYDGVEANKRTIKMLKDHIYYGALTVDNRHITLDLNG